MPYFSCAARKLLATFAIHLPSICLGGGIGRRAGFKIQCWQQRVGSIPTQGTFEPATRLRVFSFAKSQSSNYLSYICHLL